MQQPSKHETNGDKETAIAEQTFAQEVFEYVRNDTSKVETINIVYPEVDEHIHREDIFKKDRLNENIDINDIDIDAIIHVLQQRDEQLQPLTKATIRFFTSQQISFRMHLDSGANKSITPHKELLHHIKPITPIEVDGIGGKVIVNKMGKQRLICDDESSIWVDTYYSEMAPETIISPTDIALSQDNNFRGWTKHCDVYKGDGYIKFFSMPGLENAKISLYMKNGLWYTSQNMQDITNKPIQTFKPIIRRMTKGVEHELWHQRLCHAGEKIMSTIHKCTDGIPDLQQDRYIICINVNAA